MKNYEPPRVKNDEQPNMKNLNDLNQPTISVQPTSPQVIQQTLLTYQHTTRNNKPVIIPPDNDSNLIPPRRSSRIHAQTPHIISQEAINSLTMLSQKYAPQFTLHKIQQPLHFTFAPTCNAVIHPVTGKTITKYKKIIVDEVTKPVWEEEMCEELGRLAQRYNTKKKEQTQLIL